MRVTCVAVINRSSLFVGKQADYLTAIIDAISIQVIRDFAPAWGLSPVPVIAVDDGAPVPMGAGLVYVVDNIGQVPGALGWHHEEKEGFFCGFVAAKAITMLGGAIARGASSVSQTISHEVLELLGNPGVNRWADTMDGRQFSMEVCDPVDGDAYDITVNGKPISVSNFVHPSWFDPYAPSGSWFDQMQLLQEPFVHRESGYAVVRDHKGETEHFGAKMNEAKMQRCRSLGRCARARCVAMDTVAPPPDTLPSVVTSIPPLGTVKV